MMGKIGGAGEQCVRIVLYSTCVGIVLYSTQGPTGNSIKSIYVSISLSTRYISICQSINQSVYVIS